MMKTEEKRHEPGFNEGEVALSSEQTAIWPVVMNQTYNPKPGFISRLQASAPAFAGTTWAKVLSLFEPPPPSRFFEVTLWVC
jgi:hypothetical protein